MPKFRIETPSGRILTIEAATEADALRGAQEWSASQGGGRAMSGEARAASLMDEAGGGYNPIMRGLMNNPVTRAVAPGVALAYSLSPDQRRAAQQGVTFGLQDEMVGGGAALGAALGNALAGDGAEPDIRAGEAYRGVANQERARQAQFAEEAPVQNFALQAAGAAGNPLSWGGVGFIGRGANLAGQAGRGALVGAGYGGVVGAGMAQDGLGSRLSGGAGGAAAGAAFGAGAPYAATGVSRLAQLAPRVASGAQEAGRRMAGAVLPESGPARITPGTTATALDELAGQLSRRGLTPDDLLANPVEALGKPITSAEAIGRPAMGQLTALGRREGRTPDALEAMLTDRTLGQSGRVVDDFARASGLDPANVADDFAAMAAALRPKAAPLYEAAYGARPPQGDDLQNLLASRPSLREAANRAVRIAREEGRDPTTMGFDFNEAGDVVHIRTPSMQTLDYVKRGMDDVIEQYRDPVTRRLGLDTEGRSKLGTLQTYRKILTDPTTEGGRAYSAALSAGGEPLRLEQAFRDAPRLMSRNVPERVFSQRISAMGEAERSAVLQGYASNLFERARNGTLKIREFNNPAIRGKLQTLLGEKADDFIRSIEAEITLAKGGRMSPGTNSVTSDVLLADRAMEGRGGFLGGLERRLDTGQRLLPAIGTELSRAVTAPVGGFIRGFQAPYGQAVRDEVGRLLMSPPSELAGLLSALPPRRAARLPALLPYLPGQAGQSGGRATPAN